MEFISKDKQKKMEFVPLQIKEVKPNLSPRVATAVGGAGALAGSYVGGKMLEGIGRKVYGVTLPPVKTEAEAIQSYLAGTTNTKPRIATDVMLDLPIVQKTPISQVLRSPTSPLGGIGTRSMIGVQTERAANNIFDKTINPIYDILDKAGVTQDTSVLIQQAKDKILSSKKYSPSQIQEIVANIDEISQGLQPSLSIRNLDLEKQAFMSKIPQKYINMAKIPKEGSAAQSALAGEFRDAVHGTIKKTSGIDSAKLYQNWASLKGASEIGPKALTQAGRKGGAGTFASWAIDTLATPITTTTGKLTYKAGKMLQYLPSKLVDMVKQKAIVLKGMPLKEIVSSAVAEMPAGIILGGIVDDIKKKSSPKANKANAKKLSDMIKSGVDINSFKTQISFPDLAFLTVVRSDIKKGRSKEDIIKDLDQLSQ